MPILDQDKDSFAISELSIALVSPNEDRRRGISASLARIRVGDIKVIPNYPRDKDVAGVVSGHDVAIIDLDSDPERALAVIEDICSAYPSLTVMASSAHADPGLLVRCMRSGAREFLTEPAAAGALAEALERAAARQDEVARQKKNSGKLLVFVSAKGGSGVTTVASNFAVALAKETDKKVVLVDLDLYLGDAALTLSVDGKFSTLDALDQADRLDSELLSILLSKHSSGLYVLAAPDTIPSSLPSKNGVEKLLRVLQDDFDYVVIDAGSNPADICSALFDAASVVYLVVQAGVCELRNSNRFVSRYFSGRFNSKLELVLNRFGSQSSDIDEASVTKAVARPINWKVPNDFPSARRAQNTGVPMALQNSVISRVFVQMANAASGQTVASRERKKKFGLF